MNSEVLVELKKKTLKYRKQSSDSYNSEYLNIEDTSFNQNNDFETLYFHKNINTSFSLLDSIPLPPPPIEEIKINNSKHIDYHENFNCKLLLLGVSLFISLSGIILINDFFIMGK